MEKLMYVLAFLALSLVSCQRDGGSATITVSVPNSVASNKSVAQSIQAASAQIQLIIINMRKTKDSKPLHAECDFDPKGSTNDPNAGEGDIEKTFINCVQTTTGVKVSIDDPPESAGLIVQVLAIYKSTTTSSSSNSSMDFRYGEAVVDTDGPGGQLN